MKHGLTAEVVRTPEEIKATQAVTEWLVGEAVILTMRIDRAQEAEEREREHAALRAANCWDEDRRAEADRIGRGLARSPERGVIRLRGIIQGCNWMIERWEMLRDAAHQNEGWTVDQQAVAFDLQGTPALFRLRTTERAEQAAVADREIQALTARREKLRPSDAFERETVRLGLDNGATPELRLLIRYEASLYRRCRDCQAETQAPVIPAPAPRVQAETPRATMPPAPPVPTRPVQSPPAPVRPQPPLQPAQGELPSARLASHGSQLGVTTLSISVGSPGFRS